MVIPGRFPAHLCLCLVAGCATSSAASPADLTYDDTADADLIRARITDLRARNHRAPAAPFAVAQSQLTYAKRYIDDGTAPEVALQNAMESAADDGERTVRFWTLNVERLEDLKLPNQIFFPRIVNVAIAVFRRQEGAHPRYTVLLATPSLDQHEIRLP